MPTEAGTPVRVMIVEDDPTTIERFAALLSADPRLALVGTMRTRHEALERLGRSCPDVVLVDLGLPDGHGIDVIRYAKRACPGCDVMVVTVHGNEHNVFGSIEAGATGYVLKDTSAAGLADTILQLRAGGAPMSPGVARLVLDRMRSVPAVAIDRPETKPPAVGLTAREIDVLSALSRGYTYAEIGDRLGISSHTVTGYIKSSYRKLAVHTGTAAVTRAAELGLLLHSSGNEASR